MSEDTLSQSYEGLCKWCGEKLIQPEGICPKCDVEDNGNKPAKSSGQKRSNRLSNEAFGISSSPKTNLQGYDWLTTLLLCFFVGFLGVHRLYTGNTMVGIMQFLTFGGCGIWSMIDFITIITGSYRDGQGRSLVKNNLTVGKK